MNLGRVDNDMDALGGALRSLARDGSDDDEPTLGELAGAALAAVPEAGYAAISTRRRDGRVETLAATHRIPVPLEELQSGCGAGPAVSGSLEKGPIRIDDLAADIRWPQFSVPASSLTPVRAVLLLPLSGGHRNSGALSLYADRPGAFHDRAVRTGRIYAAYTALAWRQLRRGDQFREALASRDLIGQAKGIIMERFSVDAAQAFELMKRLSQTMNAPVSEVARRLIDRTADPSSAARR